MICPSCGKQMNDDAKFCSNCGMSINSEAVGIYNHTNQPSANASNSAYPYSTVISGNNQSDTNSRSNSFQNKPSHAKKPIYKKVWFWLLIVLLFVLITGSIGKNATQSGSSNSGTKTNNSSITTKNNSTENYSRSSTPETKEATEPINQIDNTYENNEYYTIIDQATLSNSIGDTIIVHKIQAKKDISVSATVLAYDSSGNVIGKSTDDITLTAGKNNYFRFSFDADISNATLEYQATPKKDSFMVGARDAVEMVQYNHNEDHLYITFRQLTDEIGAFAEFKILLYQGDTITGVENGYFSTYAKNLNGKDSTDVASIWVYGKDFDRIEYIFEP